MLGGALVENVICLLAYNDQYAGIVRNSIPLHLYGGPYRIIAQRCYDYLDSYHTPPKDHLPDLVEDRLQVGMADGELFTRIIIAVRNTQADINPEYVIGRLQLFIKRQSLRSVAVELTKALQQDTEESLEHAQELIREANHTQLKMFDPGLRLNDKVRVLDFLDRNNESFPTGIKELDRYGLGPSRKELHLLIAAAKGGKSWWLIQLGKLAVMNRLKVCHITLEMSEARVAQRYMQALYSGAKRREASSAVRIMSDDAGRTAGFKEIAVKPRFFLDDVGVRGYLDRLIDRWGMRHLRHLIVKQFPTGSLTCNQLEAYLDMLEATERFVPDLLIIDYPDLMEIDIDNARWSLDHIYKRIRGIAIERNLACAAVSQSNRKGAQSKQVEATNVAEAYSKIQHADVNITLSATAEERRMGLARLYVAAARNDTDHLAIVISQHYKTGAFSVDSHVLDTGYWNQIESEGG